MNYFSSDLHLNHDRAFIYEARGFSCIQEHNEIIVERFNSVLTERDDLYLLGDLMLGNDPEYTLKLLKALNGHKHVILGNHDQASRVKLYQELTDDISWAARIKMGGRGQGKGVFYLSHYPALTCGADNHKRQNIVRNLYGHTHQKTNFLNDCPWIYHVGVDSHNCYPVSEDEIFKDMKEKYNDSAS